MKKLLIIFFVLLFTTNAQAVIYGYFENCYLTPQIVFPTNTKIKTGNLDKEGCEYIVKKIIPYVRKEKIKKILEEIFSYE